MIMGIWRRVCIKDHDHELSVLYETHVEVEVGNVDVKLGSVLFSCH